ncbi:MAG: hypothetical protein RL745_664 [Actinomycetota bacterium]
MGEARERERQARLALAAEQAQLLPSQLPIELLPISWMLGAWRGHGKGGYPNVADFSFIQEITITTDGRPFLIYESRSWEMDDDGRIGRPLAMESGFIRVVHTDARSSKANTVHDVELIVSHPTGYGEVWVGTTTTTGIENARFTGAKMELRSHGVVSAESAKPYAGGERLYGLVNGNFLWRFDMAAMGQQPAAHVAAQLQPLRSEPTTENLEQQ